MQNLVCGGRCLSVWGPEQCMCVYSILIHTKMRRGESWTGEKFTGTTVHRAGSNIPTAAKSLLLVSFFRWRHFALVSIYLISPWRTVSNECKNGSSSEGEGGRWEGVGCRGKTFFSANFTRQIATVYLLNRERVKIVCTFYIWLTYLSLYHKLISWLSVNRNLSIEQTADYRRLGKGWREKRRRQYTFVNIFMNSNNCNLNFFWHMLPKWRRRAKC